MSRSHPSNTASSRGGGRRSSQPFNHSRSSWTDSGVHYTMETARYDSPGITFSATGGSASGLLGSFLPSPEQPRRRHASAAGLLGAGLLGTAANLLGAVSDRRHASRDATVNEQRSDRRSNDVELDESSDEDLAYGSVPTPGRSRPRSVFSRVRDRLGSDRDRGARANRPSERARTQREKPSRGDSYRTEYREPSVRSLDTDSDYESLDDQPQKAGADRDRRRDAQRLSSLEDDVEDCADQVRRSRRMLERASGRAAVNIAHLQQLLDNVEVDEGSLAEAQAALRNYKSGSRRSQPRTQRREGRPPPRRQATQSSLDDDLGKAFPGFGFGVFPSSGSSPHGLFASFMAMHMHDPFANVFGGPQGPFSGHRAAFAHDDDFDHFFAMPGFAAFSPEPPKQSRPRTSGQGPYQRPPGATVPQSATPMKPPSTIMTPSEAQHLYKTYNDRWNARPQSSRPPRCCPPPSFRWHAQSLYSRHRR